MFVSAYLVRREHTHTHTHKHKHTVARLSVARCNLSLVVVVFVVTSASLPDSSHQLKPPPPFGGQATVWAQWGSVLQARATLSININIIGGSRFAQLVIYARPSASNRPDVEPIFCQSERANKHQTREQTISRLLQTSQHKHPPEPSPE